MAFVDNNLELSDEQAVTDSAISDVIDLGANPTVRSLSLKNAYLVVDCTEEIGDGDPEDVTVTISLESDSVAALSSSPTVHWRSAALAVGAAEMLSGGNVAIIPLPVKANYERYLGVRYTVTDGPLVTGAFSAYITHDPSIRTLYPDAI